jgi:1-acyl-sn-glycerol-3-phosphate acyltransferase
MIFSFLTYILGLFSKLFIRKIEGLENIPKEKPYIIALNHGSFADPIFLIVALRKILGRDVKNIYFIAKLKLIWKIFTVRGSEKMFNILIIDPKNKSGVLERSEEIIKKNKILTISIEGKLTHDGKMLKVKTGATRLALKMEVPILPIALTDTYKVLGYDRYLPSFSFKKTIEVRIGKEFDLSDYYGKEVDKKLLEEATFKIKRNIEKLLNGKVKK